MRKEELVAGEAYHVFSKSIAGFSIFNNESEFLRIVNVLKHYQNRRPILKFSKFAKLKKTGMDNVLYITNQDRIVDIIAYCIMPTHIHLILKQLVTNGISSFMKNTLNSYTRYFNIKHKRKGPLWEGRFKSVHIGTDEQLFHLTRYIHLNPVTAYLVNRPEKWRFSSYNEYLNNVTSINNICYYKNIIQIVPDLYKKFTEDRISYQRELAHIKDLIVEDNQSHFVGGLGSKIS